MNDGASKMYNVLLIHANGTEENLEWAKKPQWEDIKRWVSGYIQMVPHFVKHNGKRCEAYVNEEGKFDPNKFPLNEKATKLWLDVLGKGPFIYKPELFGTLVIIQKQGK